MKKLMILTALLAIVSAQVYAQETPRTLTQVQEEYAQWQSVFNDNNQRYNTGIEIVERALANMKTARANLEKLVEEAKQMAAAAKKVPPTVTEEAPVK